MSEVRCWRLGIRDWGFEIGEWRVVAFSIRFNYWNRTSLCETVYLSANRLVKRRYAHKSAFAYNPARLKAEQLEMHTFYSEHHTDHDTTGLIVDGQPFVTDEVPARAELLLAAVQAARLGPVAAPKDFGEAPILAVHDAGFVHYLKTAYADNAAYFKKAEPVFPSTFHVRRGVRRPAGFLGQAGYYAFGVGSPLLEGTWDAAYWSAQCALAAAEAVRNGTPAAYALCRPPGHHADTDLYGGFCYLNNAAIAARWLGPQVAVLDIDYHHGNGTQSIFYEDPTVLFCSLHAHPDDDYPYYWGNADELGAGAGTGFNRNWPLPQAIG